MKENAQHDKSYVTDKEDQDGEVFQGNIYKEGSKIKCWKRREMHEKDL